MTSDVVVVVGVGGMGGPLARRLGPGRTVLLADFSAELLADTSFADAQAREDSDNCYDAAVARVLVDLPGGNKSSKQTVTAKVPGSPALSFEATVVVTSAVA